MINKEMWVRYSPDFLFDAKMSTNDAKKNYRLRRDSVKLTGELSFGEI